MSPQCHHCYHQHHRQNWHHCHQHHRYHHHCHYLEDIHIFAKQNKQQSPTSHGRHILVPSKFQLSPLLPYDPSNLYKLLPTHSHSLLGALALVQSDLLGRGDHLACRWVWMQILSSFSLGSGILQSASSSGPGMSPSSQTYLFLPCHAMLALNCTGAMSCNKSSGEAHQHLYVWC